MNTVFYGGISIPVEHDAILAGLNPTSDTIPSWFFRDVDGVREIAITGVLTPYGVDIPGVIGYDWILEALSGVDSVRLFIDSPGGIIHPHLEKIMRRLNAIDSECVVTGMCASAAFLIGRSCRRMVADVRSCEIGGVGAFMLLWDVSERNRNEGFKPIVIKTGKYKAIGAGGEYDESGLAHLRERLFSVFSVYLDALNFDMPEKYNDARVVTAAEAFADGVIDGVLGGVYTIVEGDSNETTDTTEEIDSMEDNVRIEHEPETEVSAEACCAAVEQDVAPAASTECESCVEEAVPAQTEQPQPQPAATERVREVPPPPVRLPIKRISEDLSAEKLFESLVKKFGSRTEAWRALERINYDAYIQLRTRKTTK